MTTQNTIFRLVGSEIAFLFAFIAFVGAALLPLSGSARQQRLKPADANEQWGPSQFHGLVLGKSTSADVIRAFGKPSWKGGVGELELRSDKEGEMQYEYSTAPGVDGYMRVIFGKRSGVVTVILQYPKHMTRADITAQFGSDVETGIAEMGPCPTAQERKTAKRFHHTLSTLLIYRKLGLWVDLNEDGSAFLVEYTARCR